MSKRHVKVSHGSVPGDGFELGRFLEGIRVADEFLKFSLGNKHCPATPIKRKTVFGVVADRVGAEIDRSFRFGQSEHVELLYCVHIVSSGLRPSSMEKRSSAQRTILNDREN